METSLGPFCDQLSLNGNNLRAKLPDVTSQLTNGAALEIHAFVTAAGLRKGITWRDIQLCFPASVQSQSVGSFNRHFTGVVVLAFYTLPIPVMPSAFQKYQTF